MKHMHMYFLGLLLISLPVWAVNPLIDLGYSKYQGTALPNGVSQWLGIRYAAPPLGNLRFRAPQDPLFNRTTQLADKHGSICLGTGNAFPTAGQSEDCLFLDVYAPSHAKSNSKLPVYFFIQGGGFNSNSNPNYNASSLIQAADMDLVVVTFNYRVGPYGFLASSELERDGDLNAGFMDQRKALQWVQDNISKFGGDPKHVVLGGDSAGAVSITLHLTAFGGKPTNLFQAVIAESQGFPSQLTAEQSQYQYANLTQRVGCQNATNTLQCLRSTDISVLQTANIQVPYPNRSGNPLFMYSPVIDGKMFVDFTQRLFQQGKFVRVPSVFGDDTNEGTVFTPTDVSSPTDMTTFLENNFPALSTSDGETINELYPKGAQFPGRGEFFSAAATAYGDMRYICPGTLVSTNIAKFEAPNPTWNYHYNVIDPDDAASGLGVTHTVELNAIWGPNNTNGDAPTSYFTTNAAIIPVMQGYWTSFIRTFNPNTHRAAGTPLWEPFGTAKNRIMLQTNNTMMETVHQDQLGKCSFLSSIAIRNLQ